MAVGVGLGGHGHVWGLVHGASTMSTVTRPKARWTILMCIGPAPDTITVYTLDVLTFQQRLMSAASSRDLERKSNCTSFFYIYIITSARSSRTAAATGCEKKHPPQSLTERESFYRGRAQSLKEAQSQSGFFVRTLYLLPAAVCSNVVPESPLHTGPTPPQRSSAALISKHF